MAVILDGADLVVCWSASGVHAFEHLQTGYSAAKQRFEEQSELLTRGEPLPELPYHDLAHPGGGISPQRRHPVGIFHALRLEAEQSPDLFACIYTRPRVLPILGPAAAVESQVQRFRVTGATCVSYVPGARARAGASPEPPSEATRSASARRVLDIVAADGSRLEDELRTLSVGELIWVGETARNAPRHRVADAAARMAVARRRSPGTLNLLGHVLRDQDRPERSIEAFEESIGVCESARWNPYAYIGLAATLRRLARYEEAWDLLKGPLKYDATNTYALRVKRALAADMGFEAEVIAVSVDPG